MTKIYIDADGCPVKDEVYRVAERYKLPVVLVANKRLNLPVNSLLEMVVVTGAFDAADDWIVKNSKPNDIVVTADILLADRCVKKSVRVLGPKGVELTADNIGSAVSTRERVLPASVLDFARKNPNDISANDRAFYGSVPVPCKNQSRRENA